jgi:hypothetical protein
MRLFLQVTRFQRVRHMAMESEAASKSVGQSTGQCRGGEKPGKGKAADKAIAESVPVLAGGKMSRIVEAW